jgi:hypothetical protein
MEAKRDREDVQPEADDSKQAVARQRAELEEQEQRESPGQPRPLAEAAGDPPRPRR